jgi:hypothetical protein
MLPHISALRRFRSGLNRSFISSRVSLRSMMISYLPPVYHISHRPSTPLSTGA